MTKIYCGETVGKKETTMSVKSAAWLMSERKREWKRTAGVSRGESRSESADELECWRPES